MFRKILATVALAALCSASAQANDRYRRYDDDRYRDQHYGHRYDDRGHYRHWRHLPPSVYRHDSGYRAGYEAGWRDAARSCRYGDRPGRWYRDRHGSWYFGFEYGGW
ncbi:MAG: hypothetical protein FJ191_07580 [Gammaproteobacteria bacterium]|nr:hypothetical protein [Gammaproteobacteria bacterium]